MSSKKEQNNNLNQFFKEEYNSLKGYVRSKIDHSAESDAEDIIQEVALKLFSRAETSSPINNVAGFVYRAIKNKIIDVMRTKTKQLSFEERTELKLIELTELIGENSNEEYSDAVKTALKKAIGELKFEYKSIIIAIDFEGYTYKEIEQETGIPKGTLMSRRHRAMAILAKKLARKKETTQ